ncbi:MAG: sugar ABC transporter ATP-binding protein [Solirubrobacteraceae bacterium]
MIIEPAGTRTPAVLVEDLCKAFGATHALRSVSMRVEPGTVHALIGENGAGKSTALGILAGRTAPTSGRVEIFGEHVRDGDPRAARRAGVVAIYQELTIVPALSAEANVFLSDPVSRLGFLSEREMRARYVALCDRIGVRPVPARTPAGTLSVAEQQVLEILRALVIEARIILFDEPTASLATPERDALFALIRALRASGTTIMFVSHNLDEVLELADTVSVFRDGQLRASKPRSEFTRALLVEAMIGEAGDDRVIAELLEAPVAQPAAGSADSEPATRLRRGGDGSAVLAATGVTVPGAITDVEIEVHAGEVVGVGGLVGSGRSTLLRALSGLEPHSRGRMWLDGQEVAWPRTVRRALSYGIALLPEDRKSQGLVLSMSAMDNIALSGFARSARHGFLSPGSVERATHPIGEKFGFRRDRLRDPARQLSGGNQQKLLLARWNYMTPRILLADEPTRGIDVGAKADILKALESMAERGLGLVIVSSELEEVASVADRVLVLSEGLMAGNLGRSEGRLIAASEILHLAFNARNAA